MKFLTRCRQPDRGCARWIAGPLERGLFGGARRSGRPRRRIEALRCPHCGHLEPFATESV